MKKVLLTTAIIAAFSASVFAQGSFWFQNNGTGYKAPIYGPETSDNSISKIGNTTAGIPAGTNAYTGALLSGAAYSVQVFAAPGTVAAADALTIAGPIKTFRTGTAAGILAAGQATITGIAADAPLATIQYRAWENKGGQYGTWALAEPAWKAGLIAAGVGNILTGGPWGGGSLSAWNPVGLQSFNIYYVPEPGTLALAGLGIASLLVFRRRK